MAVFLYNVLYLMTLLDTVNGHGFLANPVARNVRESNFPQRPAGTTNTPQGLGHNNANLNAVHGMCGDGPSGPQYWSTPGTVQTTYTEGSIVEFDVRITAHHLGYFEFELCDSPIISEDCFKQHQLLRAGCTGSDEECRVSWKPSMETEMSSSTISAGQSYPIGAPVLSGSHLGGVNFKMQYQLPEGVTCDHCVVRWHYFTTNSCTSANSGSEEFWNCADVAIVAANGGATKHTAVEGTALTFLVDKLLTQQPESTADRGNFRCSTFGKQLKGNPSWAYVNAAESAADYISTMYGETISPGYSAGCMPTLTGAEGCLFQGPRTISYWNTGGPVTQPPDDMQTSAPVPVHTQAPTPVESVSSPPPPTTTNNLGGVVCVGKNSDFFDDCCARLSLINPACDQYPETCELRQTAPDIADDATTDAPPVGDNGDMKCVGKYTSALNDWCANIGMADPDCTSYPDHCELRSTSSRLSRRAIATAVGPQAAKGPKVLRGRILQ